LSAAPSTLTPQSESTAHLFIRVRT
jgi:hypothetical protein